MAGHNENLALFYKPLQDHGQKEVEWIEYRPSGQLNSEGAIEFHVPGNGSKYMDLKNTKLKIKAKIVKADGSNLPSSNPGEGKPIPDIAKVGPVNLLLQSLWRQIDISLQQKIISPEVATRYPYKAYIETLLGFGDDPKESQLGAQLYYKDQGDPSNTDPITGTNSGLLLRSTFTEQSKTVDMEGPIFNDICQQSRYLVDGVSLGVKLWPSSNEFRLMSSNTKADYKVKIEEAVLKVCMIDVSPEIKSAHANTIKRGPALYYYDRTDVKAYAIAKGQFGTTIEDIYQGEVPRRLVVGILPSSGYNGDYKVNPYAFKDYKCNFIGFYMDGKSVPTAPLTPNYSNGNYMSAYMTLFCNDNNFGNNISRTEYPKGNCLYVFNLCENHCNNYGGQVEKGHTRLEIKLAEALTESVTVIVYALFPGLMEIDEHRNVKIH